MITSEKPVIEIIREQLKGDLKGLPVFSPVAIKVQKLLTLGNFGMADVSELICEDQSLASQVLKIANSSFYAGLTSITTIHDAIVRLGAEEVANIVMMASQFGQYNSENEYLNGAMQKLWVHSLACATGAKWLALKTGYAELAAESFMAGLLHDIGELALLKIVDSLYRESASKALFTDTLIKDVFLALHEEVGYNLMKSWGLPEKYCAVATHHKPGFDAKSPLLVLIRLTDQACNKVGKSLHPDPSISLVTAPEAQLLSLKEISLAELEIVVEDAVDMLYILSPDG